MGRIVIRESETEIFDRGAGVRSIPLMNAARGSKGVSTGMTIMEPGAGLPLHFHDTEECITCVEGIASCEIDGEQLVLQPFDHVWISEGAHHRFWNEGASPMRISWTYGKAEVSRTFVDSGQTVRHMSADDVTNPG
jgi:succinate-semialdehyde dehydrogenase/glutarate-semialdehyde dehydrogenase